MNCREYCQFRSICAEKYPKFNGEERLDSSDCPMAWKIEDGLMDARDIAEEQETDDDDPFLGIHNPTVYLSRAEMKAEEELPFTDPPEMTEEEWYEIEKQENEEE